MSKWFEVKGNEVASTAGDWTEEDEARLIDMKRTDLTFEDHTAAARMKKRLVDECYSAVMSCSPATIDRVSSQINAAAMARRQLAEV